MFRIQFIDERYFFTAFYLSAESSEENSDEISDEEDVRASKQVVMPRIASVTSLKMENERIFVSNNFQDQMIEEEEDEPMDPLSIVCIFIFFHLHFFS